MRYLFSAILFMLTLSIYSQDKELMLKEIIHENVEGSERLPQKMDLGPNAGYISFSREYPKGNVEDFTFSYEFEKDMTMLENGETYPVTIRLESQEGEIYKGSDDMPFRNIWVIASTDEAGSVSNVLESHIKMNQWNYLPRGTAISGGTEKLYGYEAAQAQNVDVTNGEFTVNIDDSEEGKFTELYFSIEAYGETPENKFVYDIIFVYALKEKI